VVWDPNRAGGGDASKGGGMNRLIVRSCLRDPPGVRVYRVAAFRASLARCGRNVVSLRMQASAVDWYHADRRSVAIKL